jgi:heat shock transcription factor
MQQQQRRTRRSTAATTAAPSYISSAATASATSPIVESQSEFSHYSEDHSRPIEISLKPQQNVAAFLNKLYNMVNDRNSNELIRWSEDGTSFLVLDVDELSRDCLPRFFKHNNFSSFVRQLNMYGFRKVPHVLQGGLLSGNTDEHWEFAHDYFLRDRPDLLPLVRRKGSNKSAAQQLQKQQQHQQQQHQLTFANSSSLLPSGPLPVIGLGGHQQQYDGFPADYHENINAANPPPPLPAPPPPPNSTVIDVGAWAPGDLAVVLSELHNIRQTQLNITSELQALKQENQMLWHETIEQQRKHEEQTHTVEKVKFIF